MKKIAISQSNYIPWKGYFDLINTVDRFIFYDCTQFTKRDWRSRNKIKTPAGMHWLTIPVCTKGKFHQKICDVAIAEQDWAEKHWKTIWRSYRSARFFNCFAGTLEDLYCSAGSSQLSAVNFLFTKKICDLLDIRTELILHENFDFSIGKTARLVAVCQKYGATVYYTGPAAKTYLEEDLFAAAGICVHYCDYSGYPGYEQLHGPFVHEVSVLDLMFNTGPDFRKYMKSFSSEGI
jgi:hypothetical protein